MSWAERHMSCFPSVGGESVHVLPDMPRAIKMFTALTQSSRWGDEELRK